jgi:hypothetical protein
MRLTACLLLILNPLVQIHERLDVERRTIPARLLVVTTADSTIALRHPTRTNAERRGLNQGVQALLRRGENHPQLLIMV